MWQLWIHKEFTKSLQSPQFRIHGVYGVRRVSIGDNAHNFTKSAKRFTESQKSESTEFQSRIHGVYKDSVATLQTHNSESTEFTILWWDLQSLQRFNPQLAFCKGFNCDFTDSQLWIHGVLQSFMTFHRKFTIVTTGYKVDDSTKFVKFTKIQSSFHKVYNWMKHFTNLQLTLYKLSDDDSQS